MSEEDEEESLWTELRRAWKQHCAAIAIAVFATALAYQSTNFSARNFFPYNPLTPHAYLDTYQRTANITFCIGGEPHNDNNLSRFEFRLPKTLIPAMVTHFAADRIKDDSYSQVLNDLPAGIDEHPQVICLEQQNEMATTKSYLLGHAYYYPKPSFQSMYPEEQRKVPSVMGKIPKLHPAHLTFTGFGAKFVNLSPKPLLLFWEGANNARKLVGELPPMQSLGTATRPGQSFYVAPVYDSSDALERWVVTADEPVLYYEPKSDIGSERDQQLYQLHLLNREFAKHYLIASGRSWLAQFPRPLPLHFMHDATYFGQTHHHGKWKLAVASVTPRVFTIDNFLSKQECDALLSLAQAAGFAQSSLYAGGLTEPQRDLRTRSSSNTWLGRQTANITDQIYARAAKLLQLDNDLLQKPVDDNVEAHHHSIAESLQVVHYRVGQEYTAHHDYVVPRMTHRYQPTRFATLLMYLNDDMEGGETVFPRAVNAQYHEGISIPPKKGRAVLFYNMLPDGNVDDLSIHSSQPVTTGEKYVANLWIWEPMIN